MHILKNQGGHVKSHDSRVRHARGIEMLERGLQSLGALKRHKEDGRHNRAASSRVKLVNACASFLADHRVPTAETCARHAGVAARLIYYYFQSMEGLCIATVKARPELQITLLNLFNALSVEDKAIVLAVGYYPADVLARVHEMQQKQKSRP